MSVFRHLLAMLCLVVSVTGDAHAADRREEFYRNYWYPMYQGQRLSYCTLNNQSCGLAVANDYCHRMGYQRANEAIIDYNVSLTQYIETRKKCKGLNCSGFTLIHCVGQFSHKPAAEYYYRLQRFDVPQFDSYRIDWCYEDGKGCGEHTAYSFCRRMGYLRATSFKQQKNIAATKTLGSRKLCFGDHCDGFRYIICYR